MIHTNNIANILSAAQETQIYAEESAIIEFTEEVLRRMDEQGITKTALAARLEVDPAYVSKLIGGSNNFTLRTMVRLSRALNSKLRSHLQPISAKSEWRDYSIQVERSRHEVVIPIHNIPEAVDFRAAASHTYTVTFDETSSSAA